MNKHHNYYKVPKILSMQAWMIMLMLIVVHMVSTPGLSIQILLDPSIPSCTLYFASEPSTSTASCINISGTSHSPLLLEHLVPSNFLGNEDLLVSPVVLSLPVITFPGFAASSTFRIVPSLASSVGTLFELLGESLSALPSSPDELSVSEGESLPNASADSAHWQESSCSHLKLWDLWASSRLPKLMLIC